MVKQDDSHKEVLSSGFSETECSRLFCPQMAHTYLPSHMLFCWPCCSPSQAKLAALREARLPLMTYSKHHVALRFHWGLRPGPKKLGVPRWPFWSTVSWDIVPRVSWCYGSPSHREAQGGALVSSAGWMPSPHWPLGQPCEPLGCQPNQTCRWFQHTWGTSKGNHAAKSSQVMGKDGFFKLLCFWEFLLQ